MGLFQPHGGYCCRHGQAVAIFTVIHGLGDALAAADDARSLGQTIDLITAPAASAYIGAGMFAAMTREIRLRAGARIGKIIYDCGPNAGHVMAGLRAGLKEFCLDKEALSPALISLTQRHGATLVERPIAWVGS